MARPVRRRDRASCRRPSVVGVLGRCRLGRAARARGRRRARAGRGARRPRAAAGERATTPTPSPRWRAGSAPGSVACRVDVAPGSQPRGPRARRALRGAGAARARSVPTVVLVGAHRRRPGRDRAAQRAARRGRRRPRRHGRRGAARRAPAARRCGAPTSARCAPRSGSPVVDDPMNDDRAFRRVADPPRRAPVCSSGSPTVTSSRCSHRQADILRAESEYLDELAARCVAGDGDPPSTRARSSRCRAGAGAPGACGAGWARRRRRSRRSSGCSPSRAGDARATELAGGRVVRRTGRTARPDRRLASPVVDGERDRAHRRQRGRAAGPHPRARARRSPPTTPADRRCSSACSRARSCS